jgi:hypothetical protein
MSPFVAVQVSQTGTTFQYLVWLYLAIVTMGVVVAIVHPMLRVGIKVRMMAMLTRHLHQYS